MAPFCLHGGDPLAFFKIDEFSKRIRSEFSKKETFSGLINQYFINNEHKLKLQFLPDPAEISKYDKIER
jgi:Zn-dependent M16 (insulinase) family peptidase